MSKMGWLVDGQWLTITLGVLGFFINTVVLIATFVWKLAAMKQQLSEEISKSREGLRGEMSAHRDDLRGEMSTHRDDLREEVETLRHSFGEGLTAIRQKINEVELDSAKVYVRRESWHQAMSQLQENMSKADIADQQWKLRLEEKFDRLAERVLERSPRSHS